MQILYSLLKLFILGNIVKTCYMSPQDLLKIATCGSFQVFKVTRNSNNDFVLKRMLAAQYPTWVTIDTTSSRKELQFSIQCASIGQRKVLICSDKLTKKVYDNLVDAGFRLIKKGNDNKPLIKVYNKATSSWRTLKKFEKSHDYHAFLHSEHMRQDTLLVD